MCLVYDAVINCLEHEDLNVVLTGRNPLFWLKLYIRTWAGMDGLFILADVEQYWHKFALLLASYSFSPPLELYLLTGSQHWSSIQTHMRLYPCQGHYRYAEWYSYLTSTLLSWVELSFFDKHALQQMVIGNVKAGICLSHADDWVRRRPEIHPLQYIFTWSLECSGIF